MCAYGACMHKSMYVGARMHAHECICTYSDACMHTHVRTCASEYLAMTAPTTPLSAQTATKMSCAHTPAADQHGAHSHPQNTQLQELLAAQQGN